MTNAEARMTKSDKAAMDLQDRFCEEVKRRAACARLLGISAFGYIAMRKGAMRRGITPFGGKVGLAAQAEDLEGLLVAVVRCQLQIIEQLAAAGDHAEEATAGAVILGIGGQMGREMIDALRQNRDLDIGASGVFVVDFEVGGGSGDFAHGVFIGGVPDNLSGVLFSIGY
jgi:hypothetical protein